MDHVLVNHARGTSRGASCGASFCAACRQTVRLATAYPAQLATNALVQSLLYAVQSLLVPLLCALAAFRLVQADALPGWIESLERAINGAGDSYNGALQRGPDWLEHVPLVPSVTLAWALGPAVDEPVEPVWPALAAFILAYTVSRAFAAVYECAVDTLFVCAVVDKDEYGGVHMSAALRDARRLRARAARPSPRRAAPRRGSPPSRTWRSATAHHSRRRYCCLPPPHDLSQVPTLPTSKRFANFVARMPPEPVPITKRS